MPKSAIKDVEGMKAFFANDPSKAMSDFNDLKQLDLDRSGTISADELHILQGSNIKLNLGDKVMELLSTHPNMLKRIKRLSDWDKP
jgi:heat shock protein HtpX